MVQDFPKVPTKHGQLLYTISTVGKAERLLQGGVLPVITQVELLWVGLYPS